MPSITPRIAIIGGGLTGTVAAIELLRTVARPFEVVVIEPEEQLGRGLAYGKADSFHLLNVRAGRLGLLSGQPSDFAAWARRQNLGRLPRFGLPEPTRAFLPRQLFGAYAEARLQEGIVSRPDVGFSHLRSVATGARRTTEGYEVALNDRPPLTACFLILATGYGYSSTPGRFGRRPFAPLDAEQVRKAKSALFVGTGMTFVDEFLRLRSRGFRGQALAVSRHGLLPEVHRANETPRSLGRLSGDPHLAVLFGSFRRAIAKSEFPASAAVDFALGLRSGLPSLWRTLGTAQQKQFLRHLRAYWNVVRHRLPPEVHAQLRHSMQGGMLSVAAGHVLGWEGHQVRIGTNRNRSEHVERQFDLVFDCSGHRPDITSPVMLSLVGHGHARADAHDLGLSVAPDGGVINRSGARSPGLFALGPLGHGSLYEITAVPEIVAQCGVMARHIAEHLQGSEPARRPTPDSRRRQLRAE